MSRPLPRYRGPEIAPLAVPSLAAVSGIPAASAARIPLCSTQAGNCRLSTTAMGAACSSVGTSNPITMSQGRDQDSNAPIYIFILPITPSSKTDAHATGIVGGGSIGSPLFLPIAASR